jgi:hypothetical protein
MIEEHPMPETMEPRKPMGLLDRAASSAGAKDNEASEATPDDEAAEGEPNVSPEEQKQYDQFVNNAYSLIYSSDNGGKAIVRPQILNSLKGNGDPKEGLATTVALVVKRTADSARESGMDISGDVMLHGGQEILEDLADLQREAGIADLSAEEIEGAMYRALDLYRETAQADGSLDTAALAQDFKQMVDADKAGRLDEVVPGASKAAERLKSVQQGGE